MKRRAVVGAVSTLTLLAGCLSGEEEPDYESGEIEIEIDGSPVDLSADRYQAEHVENDSIRFHLHEGDDQWYMEGEEPVTVAEGIDLLPRFAFASADGDLVLEHDGETYDAAEPGVEIVAEVDGERVDPTEYVLEDGDAIQVEVALET